MFLSEQNKNMYNMHLHPSVIYWCGSGPALLRLTWNQPTSAFSPPGVERRIGLLGVVSFGQPYPSVGFAPEDDDVVIYWPIYTGSSGHYTGSRAQLHSSYSPSLPWFILPVVPSPFCCLLAYSKATATFIHSYITAWLDYCCSLYVDLPAGRLRCLNRGPMFC